LVLKQFAELVVPMTHAEYIGNRNAISVLDLALPTGLDSLYSASITLRRLLALAASRTYCQRGNAVLHHEEEGRPTPPPASSVALSMSRSGLGQDWYPDGLIQTSWGPCLQRSDIHKLECVCRLGSLGITTHLDTTLNENVNLAAIGKAWLTSMIFTPNVLIIVLAQPPVMVLEVLCGVCVLITSIQKLFSWQHSTEIQSFRHFKYTSLADRHGAKSPSTPGVDGFGVLHGVQGNCNRFDAAPETLEHFKDKYDSVARTVSREGPSIVVSFADKIPFTGWYLDSPEGGADTSNFVVHASNHDDDDDDDDDDDAAGGASIPPGAWKLVGTPSWGGTTLGTWTVDTDYATASRIYDMPTAREITLFEPTAFLPFALIPQPALGYGLAAITAFVFALSRKISWIKPSIISGAGIGLVLTIILMSTEGRAANYTNPAVQVLTVLQPCLLASGLLLEGFKNAVPMLVMFHTCAIFSTVASILVHVNRRATGGVSILLLDVPLFAIIIWTITIAAHLSRIVGIRQARKLVRKDKEAYDELWKQEVERDTGLCSLNHLGRVVEMLGLDQEMDSEQKSSGAPLSQLGRKFLFIDGGLVPWAKRTDIAPRFTREKCLGDDTLFELLNCMSVPYSLDKRNPVRSCDQLYVQSMLIHSTLREKVKEWALQSQGYFAIVRDAEKLAPSPGADDGDSIFVKWADAKDDPEMCRRVKWPLLKKSSRMLEKLARVYKGDPSHLADIVRFSLFFDTFTDLTQALGCIVTDFDTKVERVKSRLSLGHDSNATAGYRDVMLNLRVCNKEAAMLGCDTNLCEIQLVLKSFGKLKTAQGHERYVMFRDLRGE
jgi:hypothetical protein